MNDIVEQAVNYYIATRTTTANPAWMDTPLDPSWWLRLAAEWAIVLSAATVLGAIICLFPRLRRILFS